MRVSVVLILLLALAAPAAAQELYVRNRPFSGVSFTEGSVFWVEVEALAKALEAHLQASPAGGLALGYDPLDPLPEVPAGQLLAGGQTLLLKSSEGKSFVALAELAQPLGLRVSPNRELGTVDVAVVARAASGVDRSDYPSPGEGATAGSPEEAYRRLVKLLTAQPRNPGARPLLSERWGYVPEKVSPQVVTSIKTEVKGDEATLYCRGQHPNWEPAWYEMYGRMLDARGRVRMVRENGRWKYRSSSWDIVPAGAFEKGGFIQAIGSWDI